MSFKEVRFVQLNGCHVPLQPWPQCFFISRELLEMDAVEVRPLTLTGLMKGVAKNFVTMNFWRMCWYLRKAGFLTTPIGSQFSIRDWQWRFWGRNK